MTAIATTPLHRPALPSEPALPPSEASITTQILVGQSRAEATTKAYAAQWRGYVRWCEGLGYSPFPATPEVVITYLRSLVDAGKRGSTIRQALAAIKAAHGDHDDLPGVAEALTRLKSARVESAMAGLDRLIGAQGGNCVKKPRALTQSEITAMSHSCPDAPQGVQDRAMLLLGCNSGLRSSEIVALRVCDVRLDGDGMDITISGSKTDQGRHGQAIFVGRLAPHLSVLDPVRALEAHLRRSRAASTPEAPLFIAWRRGGSTPHLIDGSEHGMTRAAVSDCIQRCAGRAGIEPDPQRHLSSHSLRHTFITQAFSQGVPATEIARTSRHRSLAVLEGYNQTSRRTTVVSPRLWD